MIKFILGWIEKDESLTEEKRVIVSFGLYHIFLMLINLLSLILIGISMGHGIETIVLLLLFIPLRKYAGGYHAGTRIGCFFLTNLMFIIIMNILKYIRVSDLAAIGIIFLLCTVIYVLSPIDNISNLLTENQKHLYQRKILKYIIVELSVCGFFEIIGISLILQIEMCLLLWVLTLQLLGIYKNKITQGNFTST